MDEEEAMALYQSFTDTHQIAEHKIRMEVNGEVIEQDCGKIIFMDQDLFDADAFPEFIYGKTSVWADLLKPVKEKVEQLTKQIYNFCVAIYYPDGNSGVDFHSDLAVYGDTTIIPSLSLGEEREFQLKEKESGQIHSIDLGDGSLIIMGEFCQQRYEHCLPTNPIYKNGRVNLTFRQFVNPV